MKNLLYDLYFVPWYEKGLSADQRWILENDETFSHAKKVCEKEKDAQQFAWWNDHARQYAELLFKINIPHP